MVTKVPVGWIARSRRKMTYPVMESSCGSSQVRVTASWETAADSPVGWSGTGTAGVLARTQSDLSLTSPCSLMALTFVVILLIRLDRIVGVGGVHRAGVACDGDEGPYRVDFPVAPQDDVAGDGVVLRIVPSDGHGVVGDDGSGQSRGLGWRLGGRHRGSCRAGQRLPVVSVISKADLHLDCLALIGFNQGVARPCGMLDVRVCTTVVSYPLVAEGHIGQPVGVRDARGVRRQGLPHLGVAADCRRTRGRCVLGGFGRLRRSYIDKFGPPAEPDGVYRRHPVGVKHIGCHVVVGVLGSSTSCVIYVDQEGALSLGGLLRSIW